MTEKLSPIEDTSELLRESLRKTCLEFYLVRRQSSTCLCGSNKTYRYRLLSKRGRRSCLSRGRCLLAMYCLWVGDSHPYIRDKGWLFSDVCQSCKKITTGWAGVG